MAGLQLAEKLSCFLKCYQGTRGEISDFDKKIHTESAKLSGLQKELDLYLKQKHLDKSMRVEALSLQDKLLKRISRALRPCERLVAI
jgi:cell division protein FtsL